MANSSSATMRVAQVPRAGAPFEIVERPIPDPAQAGLGFVRIKVLACGVCHSDSLTKEGIIPGIEFPRVPGHEVIGVIDAVGPTAGAPSQWKIGQRVGVGWNGGYCSTCVQCRRGDFFACDTLHDVTGITRDGGYAEYMLAPSSAVAAVPDGLGDLDAAPLMCAGLTTFNALRNSGVRPGDIVAVLGLGGLGHLGVQYASRLGFRTVAIARGADKAPLAAKLGAEAYIDSTASDPAAKLSELGAEWGRGHAGGADLVLATVTDGPAMSATIAGLAPNGSLMVLGAPPKLEVSAFALITGKRSVRGWYSGTSIDAQDTLAFSARAGVRSMNEIYPLSRANDAYERMMSGKARFRVVLDMKVS
jgi:D-arabinose 1-dehydrogenase-like Zn-dependent alcohol dehydrogenase